MIENFIDYEDEGDGSPEDLESLINIIAQQLRQGMEGLRLCLPRDRRRFTDIERLIRPIFETELARFHDAYD